MKNILQMRWDFFRFVSLAGWLLPNSPLGILRFFLNISFMIILFIPCDGLQVNGLSCFEECEIGEKKRVKVVLHGDKNRVENVELKICDYSYDKEGQHFFDPIGTRPRSNASWIQLPTSQLLLNQGEENEFYFTIDVPNDERLEGSYWSVLLIEPTESVQTINDASNGFQINVKVRYAYHIVTNFDKGVYKVKVVNKEINVVDNKKLLVVDVENNGTVFLNPKMTLKLFATNGKLEKTIESSSERLFPGLTTRYHLDGSELEGKKYKAFLLLDNGDNHLFGDTFEVTF